VYDKHTEIFITKFIPFERGLQRKQFFNPGTEICDDGCMYRGGGTYVRRYHYDIRFEDMRKTTKTVLTIKHYTGMIKHGNGF
jgi:hypothetical protein